MSNEKKYEISSSTNSQGKTTVTVKEVYSESAAERAAIAMLKLEEAHRSSLISAGYALPKNVGDARLMLSNLKTEIKTLKKKIKKRYKENKNEIQEELKACKQEFNQKILNLKKRCKNDNKRYKSGYRFEKHFYIKKVNDIKHGKENYEKYEELKKQLDLYTPVCKDMIRNDRWSGMAVYGK